MFLIFRPGLRRFVFLPAMINIVLFMGASLLLIERIDGWINALLPHNMSWLSWIIMPIFILGISLGIFYCFGLIANLVSAPFSALLAETIEIRLGGHPPSAGAGLKQSLRSILIGLMTQLSALLYQLIRVLPLFMLIWVPVVNIAASGVLILFSAWMLAIGYMSIPMGNHNIAFRETREICNQYRLLIMGLGTGILFITWVPGLNLFAVPIGAAAATLLWREHLVKTPKNQTYTVAHNDGD